MNNLEIKKLTDLNYFKSNEPEGIYTMPRHLYFSDECPGVTRSRLVEYILDPYNYHYGKKEVSESMRRGSIFDNLLFEKKSVIVAPRTHFTDENEKIYSPYAALYDSTLNKTKLRRKKTTGNSYYYRHLQKKAENFNVQFSTWAQYKESYLMYYRNKATLDEYFKRGHNQLVIISRHKSGILMKCMVDNIDDSFTEILDLKKTGDISRKRYRKQLEDELLILQPSMYCLIVCNLIGMMPGFGFVYVHENSGNKVVYRPVHEEDIYTGIQIIDDHIELMYNSTPPLRKAFVEEDIKLSNYFKSKYGVLSQIGDTDVDYEN